MHAESKACSYCQTDKLRLGKRTYFHSILTFCHHFALAGGRCARVPEERSQRGRIEDIRHPLQPCATRLHLVLVLTLLTADTADG